MNDSRTSNGLVTALRELLAAYEADIYPGDVGGWSRYEARKRAMERAKAALQAADEDERSRVDAEYMRADGASDDATAGASDERTLTEVLKERDRYHDYADELARCISEMTGVEIGEHSNLNNPWEEALEAAAAFLASKSTAVETVGRQCACDQDCQPEQNEGRECRLSEARIPPDHFSEKTTEQTASRVSGLYSHQAGTERGSMSELDKFLEAFEGRLLKAYQNCPATASPYEVLRLVRMAVSDARQDVQRTAGTEGSANG